MASEAENFAVGREEPTPGAKGKPEPDEGAEGR